MVLHVLSTNKLKSIVNIISIFIALSLASLKGHFPLLSFWEQDDNLPWHFLDSENNSI